jgi:hypothetical protein
MVAARSLCSFSLLHTPRERGYTPPLNVQLYVTHCQRGRGCLVRSHTRRPRMNPQAWRGLRAFERLKVIHFLPLGVGEIGGAR